ncbi:MAG: Veg family protein [Bacilli bacterium]
MIKTVEQVKKELNSHVGETVTIKCNMGRNKYEKYHVRIKELYNYVFLVEVQGNIYSQTKSFSYSDVITKTIKIDY